MPLLITHGFPSSVAEFLHLIEPLVDPVDGPAFHVVAPSLPGYAFSTPLSATGWTMARTARAWVELMRRLGYQRYGVHGGDIGGGVSGLVAGIDGAHVTGVHVVTDPMTAASVATFMPGLADRLDEKDSVDKLILTRMSEFSTDGSGYLAIQNSRPQTIGYGLVDSPLLQLAWIAEKFEAWTDLPIDRDQLLTTVASLVHRLRRQRRAHPVRAGALVRLGNAAGRTAGLRGLGADAPCASWSRRPGARWTEFDRGRRSRQWRPRQSWPPTSRHSSARCADPGPCARGGGQRAGRGARHSYIDAVDVAGIGDAPCTPERSYLTRRRRPAPPERPVGRRRRGRRGRRNRGGVGGRGRGRSGADHRG